MTTARCPIVTLVLYHIPTAPLSAPASPPVSGPAPEGKCYKMLQNDTEKKDADLSPAAGLPSQTQRGDGAEWRKMAHYRKIVFCPTRKSMQSTSKRPESFHAIPVHSGPFSQPFPSFPAPFRRRRGAAPSGLLPHGTGGGLRRGKLVQRFPNTHAPRQAGPRPPRGPPREGPPARGRSRSGRPAKSDWSG